MKGNGKDKTGAIVERLNEPAPVSKAFDSLGELAEQIGVSYRTCHRAAQEGKIKTVRFGGSVMVPRSEVEKILARGW